MFKFINKLSNNRGMHVGMIGSIFLVAVVIQSVAGITDLLTKAIAKEEMQSFLTSNCYYALIAGFDPYSASDGILQIDEYKAKTAFVNKYTQYNKISGTSYYDYLKLDRLSLGSATDNDKFSDGKSRQYVYCASQVSFKTKVFHKRNDIITTVQYTARIFIETDENL